MLRFKEKEDFEARFREVDDAVARWRDYDEEVSEDLRREFRDKLLISLIYHDSALEGDVLSHSEIKAAIDTSIISDSSLIPSYEDITNFNAAVAHAHEQAKAKRKVRLDIDFVRELAGFLSPDGKSAGMPYRKENPLHRLYYHDIAPPEKIAAQMRKLGEWVESNEWKLLHPIDRAAQFHWRLMAIFPWAKETGRLARILSNFLLEQERYPVAIIHSIDRQRYYEALRDMDTKSLLSVYLEAVETTANSAVRVYQEARRMRGHGRRAS